MNKTWRVLAIAWGLGVSGAALADATLYEHDDFRGRSVTIDRAVPNLERFGFNDRVSSLVIRRGEYVVCEHAEFAGRCVTLRPGDYRSLAAMGFNDRVSSIRPAGSGPVAGPGRDDRDYGRGGGDRNARAVLFGRTNMEGRGYVLERGDVVRNMEASGFNDRASSLRVERGYWVFCSDADFQGDCRTFGPGDYPQLPPNLNNRISSGRSIADRYPYQGRPNWSNR